VGRGRVSAAAPALMTANPCVISRSGATRPHRAFVLLFALFLLTSGSARAGQVFQAPAPDADASAETDHDTPSQPVSSHDMSSMGGWKLGVDGVVFGTFDRQGGRRGSTEFESQNWIMAMGHRRLAGTNLLLTAMMSAEPLTVGRAGYTEIFQEGEAYHNLQITDRQHPHDLIMQLAAAWRAPLGDRAGFTLAGGPVGEAALGPVAFMHRPSSAENPTAPLSHHIFDSTHVSMGVVLAGVDRGPIAVEGSVFRGREPDQDRYDIDFGALDSWSGRVWVHAGRSWTIQASHGFLHEPEQLEPGNQRRTNGSVSFLRQRASGFTAFMAAAGWNARRFSTVHGVLMELTHRSGRTSVYSRFENLTVETEILLFPQVVHRPHAGELIDPISAVTAGIVRDVARVRGLTVGVGGDALLYRVPELLQFTHGTHPTSFHLFVRVRPFSDAGRMWDTTLGRGMGLGGY
jgi:hypothetical protein